MADVEMGKALLLFDGVCNMCNGFVNFLIDRDKGNVLMFGSLQSEEAQKYLEQYGIKNDLSTVVLIDGDTYYTQSTAIIRALSKLGLPYNTLYPCLIIPSCIRDIVYKFVAANRYRLFGKEEVCRRPTPELKAKFIDMAGKPGRHTPIVTPTSKSD